MLHVRPRTAAADDCLVRRLTAFTGFAAFCQYARRATWMPTTLASPFAAAHRMIDGILRGAAVVRLASLPAIAPRLAEADVHVIGITYDADGRPAIRAHAAHFAGGKRDLRPIPFARR